MVNHNGAPPVSCDGVRASDIGSRVASQLLYYADRYGRPASERVSPGQSDETVEARANGRSESNSRRGIFIPLRLRQADLADVIGAVRQTVSGPIKFLSDERILAENQEQKFIVYNRAELKAYADGVKTMPKARGDEQVPPRSD